MSRSSYQSSFPLGSITTLASEPQALRQSGRRHLSAVSLRAAEKFPGSARANFEYGYHLTKIGRTAQALPYLKKAMAADPSYEEPFFFYGEWLLNEERYDEALGPLRTAVSNRPDYVLASVALAKALMRLERYSEAVKELERIMRLSPNHPQPHLLMSQLCFRMGDEERARQEKEISFRLRREDPTAMEVPQGRPFVAEQASSRAVESPLGRMVK